jgi:hypothetical protein
MDTTTAGAMNRRGLLVLLLIFIGLIVAAVAQTQIIPGPDTPPTPFLTRVFPDLSVLEIQAVRLREPASGQNLTISRDSSGSWISSFEDAALDADAASSIAQTIVLLPYQRTLPLTDETDLEEFGFQPTLSLGIEILLVNGTSHAVAVGGLSGSLVTYYALADDRPEVILIERAPIDYLLTLLRTPPLTPVSPASP